MNQSGEHFYFGPFHVDIGRRLLTCDGEVIEPLTPKAFDLLVFLIRNRDRYVGTDEILKKVWSDVAVDSVVVRVNVRTLRKALGEDGKHPEYIQGIAGKGYRFMGSVEQLPRTLAVLPFKCLGEWDLSTLGVQGEADNTRQVLGFGIADAIITRLSNIQELVVRPPSAVLKYANLDVDTIGAASELAVDVVLEGHLYQLGERARASAHLTQVADRREIWAGQFEETLTDIFLLIDSLAEKVAKALIHELTERYKAKITKRYTNNPEAEALYIQGRYVFLKSTPDEIFKAIEFFTQAIEIDPNYALAYAGIADSWVLLGAFAQQAVPAGEALRNAQQAAQKALELDNTLHEAHYALGSLKALYLWDWPGAKVEFERAVRQKPGEPTVRLWYALCLAGQGNNADARAQIGEALKYDPKSVLLLALSSRIFYLNREYDRAIEECERANKLDQFFLTNLFCGHALRQQRKYDLALEQFQRSAALSGDHPVVLAEFGHIYGLMEDKTKAEEVIRQLDEIAAGGERYVSPHLFAHIYLGLGDRDKTFEWLEKTFEEHGAWFIFLYADPVYGDIRRDRRFIELAKRVGFAQTKVRQDG